MEKALAPHSSTLAWKIPWTEEPGRVQSMGSLRVRHDWATSLSFSLSCIGEGNGNPLQCSCLENPRDGRAWGAAVYGVAQSRTRLKRLNSSSSRLKWIQQRAQTCAVNIRCEWYCIFPSSAPPPPTFSPSSSQQHFSPVHSMPAPGWQLLYCTPVLFKVLYCKLRNVFYTFLVCFYILFVWKAL